jgi:hypothetical protein
MGGKRDNSYDMQHMRKHMQSLSMGIIEAYAMQEHTQSSFRRGGREWPGAGYIGCQRRYIKKYIKFFKYLTFFDSYGIMVL